MLLSLTFTDKRLKQSIDRLSFKHRYKPCIYSTYCQLVLKLWEYFQYPVTYKLPKVILISIWEVNKVFIDWLSKLLCWGQECLSSCVSNTSLQSSAWQRHIPVRNTWRKIRSVKSSFCDLSLQKRNKAVMCWVTGLCLWGILVLWGFSSQVFISAKNGLIQTSCRLFYQHMLQSSSKPSTRTGRK